MVLGFIQLFNYVLDSLFEVQVKICAACDRLQLLQESMQLSLDDMLPQPLKNKAGWFAFSDYVTQELQVKLLRVCWA